MEWFMRSYRSDPPVGPILRSRLKAICPRVEERGAKESKFVQKISLVGGKMKRDVIWRGAGYLTCPPVEPNWQRGSSRSFVHPLIPFPKAIHLVSGNKAIMLQPANRHARGNVSLRSELPNGSSRENALCGKCTIRSWGNQHVSRKDVCFIFLCAPLWIFGPFPFNEDVALTVQQHVRKLVKQAEPEDVGPAPSDAHLNDRFTRCEPVGRAVGVRLGEVGEQDEGHTTVCQ